MPGPYILISSELNLHREVLQGVLHAQRPHLPVHAVAPAELDALPTGCEPRLVICNDEAVIRQMHPSAWILIFADGQNVALVGIGDARRTLPDASMEELVSVIDELWSLQALTTD
jgi:hypothetical protein